MAKAASSSVPIKQTLIVPVLPQLGSAEQPSPGQSWAIFSFSVFGEAGVGVDLLLLDGDPAAPLLWKTGNGSRVRTGTEQD